MTRNTFILILIIQLLTKSADCLAQSFSLENVLSYPFPSELTSSPENSKIAWAMNEKGKRNIYVATGPEFSPRKLTNYDKDDGQEISSLSISADGKWVVFVRGGDHGSREASVPVNPSSDPSGAKVQVIVIPFDGGRPNIIAEGDRPAISPKSDKLVFIKGGQIWSAALDGSAPAKILFNARGSNSSAEWSPDGSKLAFVSSRGDHSFIGIYTDDETPIHWLSPSFSRDASPKWSPDGQSIAFIRTPGLGGATDSIFARRHQPWSIWTVNTADGQGRKIWSAPETLEGSFPSTQGGANLHWAAHNRIVFVSYQDGWPHLYSVSAEGGKELQLTSGRFMVEHIQLSPDKEWLMFAANTGQEQSDIDRRHIARVRVDKSRSEMLTKGTGIESYPVFTDNHSEIAYLSSTAQRPLLPAHLNIKNGKQRLLAESLIPGNFPVKDMVIPRHVTFKAADGKTVYGQIFEPGKPASGKRAAIVYVHGGPQRQMLLGWHFMDYYSIDYALNQYLANLGFTVLSVNYRLGIGYGFDFQRAVNSGALGASEYQDIKAAGEWLASRPEIDAKRIGIYGGSYGGYLVALALGKDSGMFSAGVDIHGVNNRFSTPLSSGKEPAPDAALAEEAVRKSSPVSYIDTWISPTLIIHADDDRNVNFSQSVDLARRFEAKKFEFEFLAIPDDTHHWMKFSNGVKVSEATADFLKRKLKP